MATFDPENYTLADYAIRRRETESMTAVLSSAELHDIFDRWIETRELVTWPAINQLTFFVVDRLFNSFQCHYEFIANGKY